MTSRGKTNVKRENNNDGISISMMNNDIKTLIPEYIYSDIDDRLMQSTFKYQNYMFNNKDELTPGITFKEYELRRNILFKIMPLNSMIIIPCMEIQKMNSDAPYLYRQNSNLLYLTGFEEPFSFTILNKDINGDCQYILFVYPKEINAIKWNGYLSGISNAKKYFGCHECFSFKNDKKLKQLLSKYINNIYYNADVNSSITDKILKIFKNNIKFKKCHKILQELRLIKSKNEINLMKISCKIGCLSMIDSMKYCQVNMYERELALKFEMSCKFRGAKRLSYLCSVGSGNNGIILNYFNNDNKLLNGNLCLIDCGCEYNHYSCDITRTFPINGKFTDPQKILYNIVLNVSNELIYKYCKIGNSINYLDKISKKLLKKYLKKIGFLSTLTDNNITELKILSYNVHYVSHFIGIDIHDCNDISLDYKFKNGMTIAIEPGIYIPDHYLIPQQYRNIGIRIEDNVLITDNEPVLLTKYLPRTINEIENTMKTNQNGNPFERIKPFYPPNEYLTDNDDDIFEMKMNNNHSSITSCNNNIINDSSNDSIMRDNNINDNINGNHLKRKLNDNNDDIFTPSLKRQRISI